MVTGYRQGNEQVWLPGVATDIRYSGQERRAAGRCLQQSQGVKLAMTLSFQGRTP